MKKTLLLLVLAFVYVGGTAEDSPWVLEKEKNGIKIWTRKMQDSKIKEYKGAATLTTTVDKLVAIFKNPKNHDKLFYKCQPGSVTVVKKVSDDDFYTYMIINTPIVKDRDVVTHYSFQKEANGTVTINLEAVTNLVKEKEDYVRVPKMKGYWKFVPQAGGKVLVIHQAYSSPGGSVPDGLANSAAVDAPYDMLSRLQSMISG